MAKTVLVIDDSASLRQLVRMSLQSAGYDVVEADDGSTALTKLDGRKLHLAVCDVNMPKLDGISFVKQARAKQEYRFLPVIMLTTESQEAKKLEGKAAGAKAWIVKPFQPAQLLDAVAKLCLP
jgi:two-component system, chemotaxis family, chemotaxis protein CheY